VTAYRQIVVDGSPVGFVGLDAIFADLQAEGLGPGDTELESRLIKRVSQDNYIPYTAQDHYAAALIHAYAAYLAREEDGDAADGPRYRPWRGMDREQVPWYPTVDEDLCDGCGVCLRMCNTGALVATKDGKVRVAEPFACIVGCNACANLCKPGAILFPPRAILETLQPTGQNSRTRVFGGGR
jgi:NAD-dependent dihydropyrimidine dehydrogenase PreA subunit